MKSDSSSALYDGIPKDKTPNTKVWWWFCLGITKNVYNNKFPGPTLTGSNGDFVNKVNLWIKIPERNRISSCIFRANIFIDKIKEWNWRKMIQFFSMKIWFKIGVIQTRWNLSHNSNSIHRKKFEKKYVMHFKFISVFFSNFLRAIKTNEIHKFHGSFRFLLVRELFWLLSKMLRFVKSSKISR